MLVTRRSMFAFGVSVPPSNFRLAVSLASGEASNGAAADVAGASVIAASLAERCGTVTVP